ncbi:unnamed protein product [Mesocestoides corti]|uniref:Uncharacterized protein n=1 Tax=Mesocestoides corti TaxID=53468 RepID=A0A0R3U7T9_MESCO|nr:unnamed protein product [Mesocestoides corti]
MANDEFDLDATASGGGGVCIELKWATLDIPAGRQVGEPQVGQIDTCCLPIGCETDRDVQGEHPSPPGLVRRPPPPTPPRPLLPQTASRGRWVVHVSTKRQRAHLAQPNFKAHNLTKVTSDLYCIFTREKEYQTTNQHDSLCLQKLLQPNFLTMHL